MNLTFDKKTVKLLLDHSCHSPAHRILYEDQRTNAPGLWLVGDEGVYLMSNGDPGLKDEKSATGGHVCCYADQCNPKKMSFDDWWEAKQIIYGGDDGGEFLAADFWQQAILNSGSKIIVRLGKKSISLVRS